MISPAKAHPRTSTPRPRDGPESPDADPPTPSGAIATAWLLFRQISERSGPMPLPRVKHGHVVMPKRGEAERARWARYRARVSEMS